VGFVRAYNRGDLKAALGYFTTRPSDARLVRATDCDYLRRETDVFPFRRGVEQWLRRRFADHDRLTIANIRDESRAQPIGFVVVEYARRTSDTLRSLGYRLGIVPQGAQKLGFVFRAGRAEAGSSSGSRRWCTTHPSACSYRSGSGRQLLRRELPAALEDRQCAGTVDGGHDAVAAIEEVGIGVPVPRSRCTSTSRGSKMLGK